MAQSKSPSKSAARPRGNNSEHSTISGRWLLTALAISVPAAAFCTWVVFCLLFWQGSWQLIYHPTSTVTRTPASIGLAYDTVSFATANIGAPQIQGWWIPATSAKYTALYLHDQAGNLGNTLTMLAELHASGMNVFAFDYRGYGQSQFVHPSEAHWKQDATWALDYLTATRHMDPHSIVMMGSGLGANLALAIATAHPELAGVVLESPIGSPVNAIFNDPRAKLVPARLLVRDRYDLGEHASTLRISSLWFVRNQTYEEEVSVAFGKVAAPKTRIDHKEAPGIAEPLRQWLSHLSRE
jgi:hypothetical protein